MDAIDRLSKSGREESGAFVLRPMNRIRVHTCRRHPAPLEEWAIQYLPLPAGCIARFYTLEKGAGFARLIERVTIG